MKEIILVGVGGFFGAVCRYLTSLMIPKSSPLNEIPYDTLLVNLIGSFVIGGVMVLLAKGVLISPKLGLLITTGFLGALTTYSAFSFETLQLIQTGQLKFAVLNATLNLFGTLLCAAAGWYGISALLRELT